MPHAGLHWTEGKKSSTFYLATRSGVTTIGTQVELFEHLEVGFFDVVRVVRANPGDGLLNTLAAAGHRIAYTHWHQLGVEKRPGPEAIAVALCAAPAAIFREFSADPDLCRLRQYVSIWKQFQHTLVACARIQEGHYLPEFVDANPEHFKNSKAMAKQIKADIRDIEKKIIEIVSRNREAILFAEVAGMKEPWLLAARLLAIFGTLLRFPNVAKLWRYSAMDGPNGRPQAGKSGGSGRVKAVMATGINWTTGRNPWRKFYLAAKADEQAKAKASGAKVSKGAIHGRARRKMWKEILKRWFLKVHSLDYYQARPKPQKERKTHGHRHVARGRAAGAAA